MAEFLNDPSVLTKDKLKSALLANNVALPNGEQKKGVYVDLYLKNLTSQNKKSLSVESFSSDEELTAASTGGRSRSGRKATRKTDRVRPEEVDVMELTDEDLKEHLQKYNVDVGPIMGSTRKLYEKKLQRLLDQGPPETVVLVSRTIQTDSGRNGNVDLDQYSDKEEETEFAVPELEAEPELEPEQVPLVERPLRSRGKTPVTSRTRSSQNKIEKLSAVEQNPRTPERNILREMFPNETLNTPTGISATCRQPIKGAAGRPFSDAWLDNLRPRLTEFKHTTSSYTESRSIPHLNTSSSSGTSAVPLSATKTPVLSSIQPKTKRRLPVWVQLLLLSAVTGFILFVYQAMESNETSPFGQLDQDAALNKATK